MDDVRPIQIGNMIVNQEGGVSVSGKYCRLPKLQLAFIGVLAKHSPNPVSERAIMNAMYGERNVRGVHALRNHLHRLRQSLAQAKWDGRIRVSKVEGYTMCAPPDDSPPA